MNNKGYTLLEILVATAVIGVLLTVSSAIFINTVLSNNKASIVTEAKENAALIQDTLERDVRGAATAVVSGAGNVDLTLTFSSTPTVVWHCRAEAGGNNGYISRQVTGGTEKTLTNRDRYGGVSWSSCSFTASTGNVSYLVRFVFSLTEGVGVHTSSPDLRVVESNQLSVTSRGY